MHWPWLSHHAENSKTAGGALGHNGLIGIVGHKSTGVEHVIHDMDTSLIGGAVKGVDARVGTKRARPAPLLLREAAAYCAISQQLGSSDV